MDGDSKVVGTSLALLTFLNHSETPASEEYGTAVSKGAKYLLSTQDSNGVFRVSAKEVALEHGIACYAVSCFFGMTKTPESGASSQKAADVIVKAQHESGLWGMEYTTDSSDDLESTVWQIMALKACDMAGQNKKDGRQSMKKAGEALKKILGAGNSLTNMGPVLLALQLSGYSRDGAVRASIAALDGVRVDWDKPGFDNPVFHWHFLHDMYYHYGGAGWANWNQSATSGIVKNQMIEKMEGEKDCGHWTSPGKKERYGRVYATALCAMMFEKYYRHQPSYSTPTPAEDGGKTRDKDGVKIDIQM